MAKRFALIEPLWIHITERQKDLAVGQDPVKAVVGVSINRIPFLTALPNPVELPEGRAYLGGPPLPGSMDDRFEKPIKQHFAVVFSLHVLGPRTQGRFDFARNIKRAVMNKEPPLMAEGLGMW